MDDLRNNRIDPGEKNNKPADFDNEDAPIPFDDSEDAGDTGISHAPVNLSSSNADKTAKKKIVSAKRVTGVKTFCTKLHEGSIEFVDERIKDWLAENPGIIVKRTNTATGIVTGKKPEPSIIITIWY